MSKTQVGGGVNHSRCCAIADILWSRSRPPRNIKILKKIGDGYIIAAKSLPVPGNIRYRPKYFIHSAILIP